MNLGRLVALYVGVAILVAVVAVGLVVAVLVEGPWR